MRTWMIESLAKYASYHTDIRNELTHHAGVPVITFSVFFALAFLNIVNVGTMTLTGGGLALIGLAILYVGSTPIVGIATTLVYAVLCALAHALAAQVVGWAAVATFAALFVGGWVIQLWGHVFEGRKPALVENATQALMAPIFLTSEILFRLGVAKGLEADVLARRPKYFAEGDPRRQGAPATAA